MGKLRDNQAGFGAIETVLLVVVVAVIGFVAWYVYKANNNANKTLNQATQVSSTSPHFAKTPAKTTANTAAAQASAQAKLIQSALEAYYKANQAYPGDLTPANLVNLPGVSGVTSDTFTAPAGTKFDYKPAPSGCTTAAKDCKSYVLEALDTSTNTVITVVTSKA